MLRFKNDDGSQFPDWEKKKISDIFSKVKDKNKDGQNQNVITNSAEFGLINQRDFFDKDIAVDGKTENYTVIKTGDFVYNPRKSKQAPYGPFNCYHLEEDGIVSPLYTCLRPKGIVDNEYLQWYFQSGSWYRFIYENGAQNGARHDRVGMTDSLMQEIPIYLPQLAEEQQKIADFLSTIDTVISNYNDTVKAWEERKKGVMQKLFGQEVRFKADDGSDFPEWEEKKLGDVADFFNGDRSARYPKETDFVKYGVAFLNTENLHNTIVDISEKCKYITYEKYCELSGAKIQLLDIIYCLRGSVGLCSLNTILEEGTVASSLMVIRAVEGIIDPIYLYNSLNSDFVLGQLYQCLNGSCAGNLSAKDMAMFKIKCPCLAEQQKIADCLSSLDEVIEKQKATLAAWEELKKGLLQQMFV